MKVSLLIDNPQEKQIPPEKKLKEWINLTVAPLNKNIEISIAIVDEEEGKNLNKDYRQRDYATNILSFPSGLSNDLQIDPYPLGDLVICPSVMEREAKEKGISLESHYAHLIIHSTLHLLGYDHIEDAESEIMQNLEINLLAQLNYPDPYETIAE